MVARSGASGQAEEIDLITVVQAGGYEGEARAKEAWRRAHAHARIPFDVDGGRLSRIDLVVFAPDDALLLLTQHHLVTDGWSIGVLARDLMRAYLARAGGCAPDWTALPVEYGDLILREREWLESDSAEQTRAWWHERLAGLPPLELPFRRRAAAMPGDSGDSRTFRIDGALTSELQALAVREGTTPFVVLFAAFAALLHRYSRLDDFGVGIVTANRPAEDQRDTVGFLSNTIVLRCDMSGAPSFSTWLTRATDAVTETIERQRMPFFELTRLAESRAHRGLNPLVEACFAFENVPVPEVELPGLACRPMVETPDAGVRGTAKFDLVLVIAPAREGFTADFQFATELFDAPIIERMIAHFMVLLEAAVRSPGTRLSRLPLLTRSERRQMLVDWNANPASDASESDIAELVEAQAARTPDAPALVRGDEVWSYATLNRRANRLAWHLRTLGVGPEARVALCAHRRPETVAGMLAVLKAGAAYVPIDPTYPAERQSFILEDSAASVVMGHQALLTALSVGARPVVDLEQPWLEQDGAELRTAALPDSLAYVIYTSGSTGRPKGVENTRRGLMNLVRWHQRAFGVTSGDRATQIAAIGFDAAVWELWPYLTAGASVHMPSDAVREDPEALRAWLIGDRITVSFLATPLAEEMLGLPWPQDTTLRFLLTGADTLRRYPPENPPFALVNNYGPTECAVVATSGVVRHEANPVRLPTIGRPIDGVRAYVLGDGMEPVPPGCDGELYVGGAAVARGYRNAPEQTAERFVPDPFGDEMGSRLYRTGDLARWTETGELEFVGRTDQQVKVRGFRIELGEIEAVLNAHAAVVASVIVAREDTPGEKRLVAYVVAREGDTLSSVELRTYLKTQLPEYMVPVAYIRLASLPLTANGKLDRKGLPMPEGDAYASRGYEEPEGEIETKLASIWGEVLKLDRVGRHDNFFELGGHSLLAVRMVTRLRQALNVEATIRDLFVHPVLGDLARFLEGAARAELPPIVPTERNGQIPLSFAQKRLWFLAQMKGVSEAYHISGGLRVKGELDGAALRRALDRIVARHEALRTSFACIDGEPVLQIAPAAESSFNLIEHDLRQYDDAQGEFTRLATLEASASFDLEHGPLIRGRLVRLAADEHALVVTMHHIVSDGWSIEVLVNELSALYGGFLRGEDDPLPELAIQYADYAVWQRRWIEGEILQQQATYWKTALAGAPALLELPSDHPRPAQHDFTGGLAELVLDEPLASGLKALSRRYGTTLFITLLAGWATLLSRLSGQQDMVIGTPTANRGRAEIENLIGFFVNTLAVRLDLSGSPSVSELLARVMAQAITAQQHQDIPFEQVVELAQPVRSLAHSPLFQVMFAWQNKQGEFNLPGLELVPLTPSFYRSAKFDLTLFLQEAGQTVVGGIEYATSIFEPATIERYLGYFRNLLEAMVANDNQAVDRLPILTASERHQLLYGWNDTKTEFPWDKCVHELFEEQVRKSPDAVAVVFEKQQLSYAELNRRANQLAHHLRALGVKPDARVAICAERSFEMVVALLAVLKAGGAYVPLDPAYPPERLRFMIEDSKPAALLTQSHLGELFTELDDALPVLDLADAAAWQDQRETNAEAEAIGLSPNHLAYIIYTSGSTGNPKGVMVEQRNVVRLFSATDALFHFDAHDVWTFFHSYAFDFSVWEIWGALLYGGRLIVVPKDTARSPEEFHRLVCREKVTVLNQTPSAFRQFITAQAGSSEEHCLRYVVFGGEALEMATLKPWYEKNEENQPRLINMYGITETTVHVTHCALLKEDAGRRGRSPIGKRIPDLRVYILDAHGEPVPVGVAGELFIGGAGVARGYLNRPELTAERFLKDRFVDEAGARMYRTGDLGRWLSDGNLEFLGRNDFQVKIRGFRIELGEIEARLAEYPDVREAVVMAREDTPGDKRLVAYYTTSLSEESKQDTVFAERPSAEQLRSHLSGSLPEYMVPVAYIRLASLPLTANGKLDRKGLPMPEGDAYASRGYEEPEGEIETKLASIWGEVLKLDRVGRHDNFFELGGHSLLAVRLFSMIEQRLGRRLPLGVLYRSPTIKAMAKAFSLEPARSSVLVPFAPVGDGPKLFCVHPGGGAVMVYKALADHLRPAVRLYGLQAPGVMDAEPPLRSIEAMAQRYVLELRAEQPHGPYHVGGYSLGGGIAFEMSTILMREGEEVATLVLIDSAPPGTVESRPSDPRIVTFFARIIGIPMREEDVPELSYDETILYVARKVVRETVAYGTEDEIVAFLHRALRLLVVMKQAWERYKPRPYPGALVFLTASEGLGKNDDRSTRDWVSGWRSLVEGPITVDDVPGTHETIVLEPNVRELARMLSHYILSAAATPLYRGGSEGDSN